MRPDTGTTALPYSHPVPSRPVVLVTTTSEVLRSVARIHTNAAYVHALEQAGCAPLLLPPLASADAVGAAARAAHGVLLTGGEDVDPARYGAERQAATDPANAERDAMELRLVAEARHRRVPVLAICRGVQLLNVACGGTLVQHLPDERPRTLDHAPDVPRARRAHDVTVDGESRLAAALGATRVAVNSLHHQAVQRVGAGLRVSARSSDGVVEGLEAEHTGWWAVGVQWHPEELVDDGQPWDRALFAAFVRAAGG